MMSSDEEVDKLIIAATESLKDDREIHLEVQHELRNHLEDKIEELLEDELSQEDAKTKAIKSFGSCEEIGKELLNANLKKMKIRSLAKMAVRFCIFPIAMMCLVWVMSLCFPMLSLNSFFGLVSGSSDSFIEMNDELKQMNPNKRFLIEGDLSRKSTAQQQRAIWEKYPENLMYFSNYFTYLLSEKEHVDEAILIKECKLGQKIDPTNARYDLILAALMLDKAYINFDDENRKLVDMKLKNEAIDVLKISMEKKRYENYSFKLIKERASYYPKVNDLISNINRISLAASALLPDLSHMRKLVNYLPEYLEGLNEEELQNNSQLLNFWLHSANLLHDESYSLIEILVGRSCINIGKKKYLPLYKKAGLTDQHIQMEKLISTFEREQEEEKTLDSSFGLKITQEGGVLAGMLLPALNRYGVNTNEIDLKWTRWLEFLQIEKMVLGILCIFFAGASLIAYGVSWRWKYSDKLKSEPFMLLLNLSSWANFIGIGVVLPLMIYYFYTRLTNFSGRDFSLTYLYHRHLIESTVFISIVFYVFYKVVKHTLDNRFDALNIPRPITKKRLVNPFVLLMLLGIIIAICNRDGGSFNNAASIILSIVYVGILFFSAVVITLRFLFPKKEHRVYFSSMGRTLAPMFSLALILLSVISVPYITFSERSYLEKDQVIGSSSDIGFTVVEDNLVEKLKKEYKKTLEENK